MDKKLLGSIKDERYRTIQENKNDSSNEDEMTGLSRRSVLQSTGAAGVAATTGLIGLSYTGTQIVSADDNDVFQEVRSHWEELVIMLTEMGAADSVTILDPDGQEFASTSPRLGEQSVRTRLLPRDQWSPDSAYEPGTYTAVAFDEENTELAELSFEIEPEVEISGFESRRGSSPFVAVENTGSGPVQIQDVSLVEGPPDGTTASRERRSPLETIPPGESIPVWLDGRFDFESQEDAESALGESFEFVLEIETIHDDIVTETIDVTYEGGLFSSGLGGFFAIEEVSGGEVFLNG